jgi:ligand-binding sensor domain-containing protein
VHAIAKDARGNLWFGTNGNGLVRFDPHSGRYRVYAHVPSDPRSLSYDRVTALWIDRGGTLWAATDFGLNRLDSATDEFRRYSPQPGSLTQYRSIAEEASGVLWLGTARMACTVSIQAPARSRSSRTSSARHTVPAIIG